MKWILQLMIILSLFCTLLSTKPSKHSFNEAENSQSTTETDLSNSINEFGYKLLYKMSIHNKNNNIIMSPIAIAGLFAMTLVGTVGMTYEEIADSLGFSQDIYSNREKHNQFGKLLQQLSSESSSSKSLYADAIYVDKNTKLRESYREYVKRVYRGDAFSIDFKDSTSAKDSINEWVRNNTEAEIKDLLKSTLPLDTQIVLLSAFYFNGQWKHVFLPEFTTKMPFLRSEHGVVEANFMLNVGNFRYISSENYGAEMVALPYNDSVTTMYVLKPTYKNKLGLVGLLANLDHIKIDQLISQMATQKCVIRLPKMELERANKLETYLKDMGMISIFDPLKANFALMVDNDQNTTQNEIMSRSADDIDLEKVKETLNSLPNPGIYVDSVLHDVKLTVNEYGTEAVAATAGILARTAQLFYADSPFYMFIRDERTKLVTFSACIFDPTS